MEFGSDFHHINDYPKGQQSLHNILEETRLYGAGRHALEDLLLQEGIKKIYVPSYYCHSSLEKLQRDGIEVIFYPHTPFENPNESIAKLDTQKGEAILVMNYFGLGKKPDTYPSSALIIEDHSHGITSGWALQSNADWCFASLRKSMPIADGGILWSPKGKALPQKPELSASWSKYMDIRYAAMKMKTGYLKGKDIDKSDYLRLFHLTEEAYDRLGISSISRMSSQIVSQLDIEKWIRLKKRNWSILSDLISLNNNIRLLIPQEKKDVPFSFTLVFENQEQRDLARQNMIQTGIYPAILWEIPDGNDIDSINLGRRILSIHCDGRYSEEDIVELAKQINTALKYDQGNKL